MVALVDDIEVLVRHGMVYRYLSVLPFGHNMTEIKFDCLVFLVHRYIPNNAPKDTALIEIYLDLFSAIDYLEPIYRQDYGSAWSKHQLIIKRYLVEYLLAPYY